MKNIRKAIALVLAVAALFCLPIQASADEASATIDYTRTGSLSIYKYDLTRAESDGAWDTNAYVSTGIYDQSVVDRMTDYTVPGVEFMYLRVADIAMYTEQTENENRVITVYGFADGENTNSLLATIGLPMTTLDGSAWNYDVTVYPKNRTGYPTLETYFIVLHPGYLEKSKFNNFSVDRESDNYKELEKSIEINGIKDPVIARPKEGGGYEIISGQRRHDIAKRLNFPVPTIVQQMDDDDAKILVADGNLHRDKLSSYDLSRALRMKMDAMKHKSGRRRKGDIGPKIDSNEVLAREMGINI